MSIQSQQNNMIRLHELLKADLGLSPESGSAARTGQRRPFCTLARCSCAHLQKILAFETQ